MNRRAFVAAGAAVGIGGSAARAEEKYRGYEQPEYAILWQEGPIELRRYAPHLAAEVTVRGDRRQAANAGFRTLAGYIFGGNSEGAKIAMTVPVTQEARDGETWVVRFMVPAKYDVDALPTPDAEAIRFSEVPGGDQLVARFSGIYRARRLDEFAAALRRVASEKGLTLAKTPRLYFYDDPFTLPWRRRNEVAFDVL